METSDQPVELSNLEDGITSMPSEPLQPQPCFIWTCTFLFDMMLHFALSNLHNQ